MAAAEQQAANALDSGAAAERFARMVAALGGPTDVLEHADALLPRAPVQRALIAPHDGVLAAMDTRAIGLVVVALGGGRALAGDAIDPRVGIGGVLPVGTRGHARPAAGDGARGRRGQRRRCVAWAWAGDPSWRERHPRAADPCRDRRLTRRAAPKADSGVRSTQVGW